MRIGLGLLLTTVSPALCVPGTTIYRGNESECLLSIISFNQPYNCEVGGFVPILQERKQRCRARSGADTRSDSEEVAELRLEYRSAVVRTWAPNHYSALPPIPEHQEAG